MGRESHDDAVPDESLRLADGSRVDGPAVNRGNTAAEIGAQWQSARPQLVVIDDLLTLPALEKLRRFCWGSTFWRSVHEGGYLGAMPEHGFAAPLLAQIGEELRAVYPAIIGGHPLLHLWAFKYDSSLHGINVHADFAAVNVNFWITPDEANLDPGSGGLKVWGRGGAAGVGLREIQRRRQRDSRLSGARECQGGDHPLSRQPGGDLRFRPVP